MTGQRAITVAAFSKAYDIPEWSVRKQIRQKRIRAINFGTPLRPMYRIPVSEAERIRKAAA